MATLVSPTASDPVRWWNATRAVGQCSLTSSEMIAKAFSASGS